MEKLTDGSMMECMLDMLYVKWIDYANLKVYEMWVNDINSIYTRDVLPRPESYYADYDRKLSKKILDDEPSYIINRTKPNDNI